MVLRAEGFEVHVQVWGNAAARQMTGQIRARDTTLTVEGARLHLLRDGERLGIAVADHLGEFLFNKVPDGLHCLQIDLPYLTVVGTLSFTN